MIFPPPRFQPDTIYNVSGGGRKHEIRLGNEVNKLHLALAKRRQTWRDNVLENKFDSHQPQRIIGRRSLCERIPSATWWIIFSASSDLIVIHAQKNTPNSIARIKMCSGLLQPKRWKSGKSKQIVVNSNVRRARLIAILEIIWIPRLPLRISFWHRFASLKQSGVSMTPTRLRTCNLKRSSILTHRSYRCPWNPSQTDLTRSSIGWPAKESKKVVRKTARLTQTLFPPKLARVQ